MKDEKLIVVVFDRSPGRARQVAAVDWLASAAAGTGGDSSGRHAVSTAA